MKIITTLLLLMGTCLFSQNKTEFSAPKNYYKINKLQKEIVEFYTLATYFYPNGKVRSSDTMYGIKPEMVGVSKDGKLIILNLKKDYMKSHKRKIIRIFLST